MNKDKLRDMVRDYLARPGDRHVMAISAKWKEKPKMALYFYRSAASDILMISRKPNVKEFELVSNRRAETQEYIALCSVGEAITIELDEDAGRYAAMAQGDICIGLFPLSATNYLEEYHSFDARISDIEEDEDTGKYTVRVILDPDEVVGGV